MQSSKLSGKYLPSSYVIASQETFRAVAQYADQLSDIRNDSIGRPSCLHCVEKHISAALVALSEVEAGYPAHRLLVIGHLHEASEEAREEYPELADLIRQIRLNYCASGEFPTIYEWYDLLEQYAFQEN